MTRFPIRCSCLQKICICGFCRLRNVKHQKDLVKLCGYKVDANQICFETAKMRYKEKNRSNHHDRCLLLSIFVALHQLLSSPGIETHCLRIEPLDNNHRFLNFVHRVIVSNARSFRLVEGRDCMVVVKKFTTKILNIFLGCFENERYHGAGLRQRIVFHVVCFILHISAC